MRTIRFSPPDISQAEIDEVVDTLKSGWITTGPKTKKFEKEIAAYCHTSKAVALNSATACMELTLRILGVGEGDEVITSAYTYTASASVIAHVGAKIVLVDCSTGSFHIDYNAIADAITDKTKVIIPVDIAGVMCDYDKLFEIIERKRSLFRPGNEIQKSFGRIVIMADAAHSMGAIYKGKMSGEVADFTSFSFHVTKNLTTGEGGAVTWHDHVGIDNEEWYHQYMLLSLHGQSKDALAKMQIDAWEYDIVDTYYKCNMTDIMASLGLVQLARYQGILAHRKEMIKKYDSLLANLNVKSLCHYNENQTSSGHLYLLNLCNKDVNFRNRMIEKMRELGVETNVHYKPLPMHTAYRKLGFDMKDYPNAYDMYRNEITLPLHTLLTNEDVEYVAECLKEIWEELHSCY